MSSQTNASSRHHDRNKFAFEGARALRGIQGLPPEILAHIFSFLTHASPKNWDLLVATHICQGWRAVALDHAALWTTVFLTDIEMAETYISRSKGMLLNVHIWGPSLVEEFAPILASVTNRLQTLIIATGRRAVTAKLLTHLVGRPALHLQTLHIPDGSSIADSSALPVEQSFNIFQAAASDGAELQSGSTPSLRTLRVDSLWLSWDSGLYNNLSFLQITSLCSEGTRGFPSQKQLLTILKQCPTLQSFTLELAEIIAPLAPLHDPAWTVALPLLSTLAIRRPRPSSIAGLLSHLVLPPSTRYDIYTYQVAAHAGGMPYAIFPENRAHLPGLQTFTRVELTVSSGGCLDFRLFSPAQGHGAGPVATLSVVIYTLQRTVQGIPPMILESAETVVFRGHPFMTNDPVQTWSAFFRTAARLRVLGLACPGRDLVNALRDLAQPLPGVGGTHVDAGAPASALPCPELTRLEFADFTILVPDETAILDFVRARREAGVPVKEMKFVDVVGLSMDFLQSLRDAGINVDTS